MFVSICQQSRTATQSGRAASGSWILEFLESSGKTLDPLMGWTGSSDTQIQVKLKFDSKEDAISFAEKKGYEYYIIETKERKSVIRKNGYGENFATQRRSSWTH